MSEKSPKTTILSADLDRIPSGEALIWVPTIDNVIQVRDELPPDCGETALYVMSSRKIIAVGRTDGEPMQAQILRETPLDDSEENFVTMPFDIFKEGNEEIPFIKKGNEFVDGENIGRWSVWLAHSSEMVTPFVEMIGPAVLAAHHQKNLD